MNLKKILTIVLIVICHVAVFAQESFTVKGTITSLEDGFPIPGVNIIIVGQSKGTTSNFDGYYELKVKKGDLISFSYTGKKTITIDYQDQETINVSLEEQAAELEQVIVIGYGTQKKSHLTGSVSKLENTNLGELPISSIDQGIKGKIAGVQIQNVTSDVGEPPVIKIRGSSSISASSSPLIVVDGFPFDDGLEFIDPSTIKSIEVLKDASSTAIYGSRGANGVILVTTKDGGDEKVSFELKTFTGLKRAYKKIDIVDIFEYSETSRRQRQLVENLRAEQAGEEPNIINFTTSEKGKRAVAQNAGVTDWQDEALRSASEIRSYQFNVSGGNKKNKYFISSQYISDEGLLRDNELERINFKAKLTSKIKDNLKMGVSITPSYTKVRKSALNYTDAKRMQSWLPVVHNEWTSELTGQPVGSYSHPRHYNNTIYQDTDVDGNFLFDDLGNPIFTDPVSLWTSKNNNPIAGARETQDYQNDYRIFTNGYFQWKIAKGLNFKTNLGAYLQYTNRQAFVGTKANSDGFAFGTDNNRVRTKYLIENTLNYDYLSEGGHDFSFLIGTTYEEEKFKFVIAEGSGFATDFVPTLNYASIINAAESTTFKEKETLVSYLGRINYSYKSKYLISLVARADGNSRFGSENLFAIFPSASIGYNISEENFWKNNLDFINRFKIRTSVGFSGNNDIPYLANTNVIFPTNYSFGEVAAGLAQNNETLGNKELTWEKTIEYDSGFDLSLFNNKINLTADYYYSLSDALLLQQNVSLTTGSDKFWNNVGKLQNQGTEFELSTNFGNENFTWKSSANISFNKNKLISFGGPEQNIESGERDEKYINRVGDPYIQFYGYRTDGIWNSQEEIDNNPSFDGDQPGGIRISDVNGDGILDADDRTVLGNPFPDFNWGFSNTFSYKGIDLNILIQGSQGAEVIYGEAHYQEIANYQREFFENRWFSPDFDAENPIRNSSFSWVQTDYAVQDASYVSLREVVLGYSLPSSITKKLGLNRMRIYATGQNLFYLFANGYTGLNPEAIRSSGVYASPLITGYQRGERPIQRQITLGIDLKF